jgi:hypothetical protein
MVAEVAIPEEEAAHFPAGCSARLCLNAFAGRSWSGSLERIHPRAELRDDRQVFIAEMPLNNDDGALRPGMRGKAQLIGPKRSLGWIWLHRPWEALRQAWRW